MGGAEQKVIVTGAARGLGQAIADGFLTAGAQVVGIDIREEITREGSAEAQSGAWRGLAANLTNGREVKRAVRAGIEALGGVTTLINGAGGMRARGSLAWYDSPTLELTEEQIDDTIALSVKAALLASIEVARHLIEHGRPGSIVNIGSYFGERPAPRRVPYGLSKAAITNLTQSLASEWGEYGIRVNELVPYAKTDATRARMDAPETGPQMMEKIALRRFAEAAEMVPTVLFMCSDDAAYMNGARIHVDGGRRS
ncbi:MAG TPA: SDR family oxidoreductase [Solirubrobacteraceae bacterium]|nr:SDR family oxidoreductase [Solirubrobacteraceae bacterium]